MKTTKAQYNYFCKKVEKFLVTFGLVDWKVYYSWGCGSDNLGECHFHTMHRNATIKFTKEAHSKLNNDEIGRIAFHEVCELFFAELNVNMNMSDDLIAEIIHRKIRTLENILYPDIQHL